MCGRGEDETALVGVLSREGIAGLELTTGPMHERDELPRVAASDRVVVRKALVLVGRFAQPSPRIFPVQQSNPTVDDHGCVETRGRVEIWRAFGPDAEREMSRQADPQHGASRPVQVSVAVRSLEQSPGELRFKSRRRCEVCDRDFRRQQRARRSSRPAGTSSVPRAW